MGKINRRAINLLLCSAAVILAACAPIDIEGYIPTEGTVLYIGEILQDYKNGPDVECELIKEQKVKLLGEVEHNGTTYVKVSRKIEDPGTCDLTAQRLLINKKLLLDSQSIFPGQRK